MKQYLDFPIGRVYDENRNAHEVSTCAGKNVPGHGMRPVLRQIKKRLQGKAIQE